MLIHLDKSKLFTEDPADRFAKEYGVSTELWHEIWRRFMLLSYTVPELCEYFEIKTKRKMNKKAMYRWIVRNEIYIRALPIRKKGALVVTTEFFVPFEEEVIKEITRNMKSGISVSSRVLV